MSESNSVMRSFLASSLFPGQPGFRYHAHPDKYLDTHFVDEAWKSFLQDQGAVLDGDRVRHFGHPEQERRQAARGNVLVDLSDHALIRARGPDAQSFLNGQLSNDLRQMNAANSQLASWCSPKGRMLVIFRLFKRGDDILLQLPASLLDSILKRLRMFVLRAKATLENAETELTCIGLSGADAENLLKEAAGFAPTPINGCETRGAATIIRLPGPHPRYQIIGPATEAMKLWEKLKRKTTLTGPSTWAWLDIMAGIPVVHPETSEFFVPQMANLEAVGGVNFKKGCYPGQEIVARMQYLGKLKQRMYRAHVDSPAMPRPGDPIYAPNFPGQAAGNIVDAQSAPEGGYDLLAVIQIGSAEAGELHLGDEAGPRLSLQTLAYSLPLPATRAE